MLGSTFEEEELLKVAFDNQQKSLASSPLMHDMQPVPGSMEDYMQCSDGTSLDNNHSLMSSMMIPLSGHSHFDDLSSSIINSQNLSPFANNFLSSLCPSPHSDMLLDSNIVLQASTTTNCDSASSLLYLNADKNGVTSTVADSSSGSVCTSVAASSTDVDDALLRSIEEGDCFFDSTPSPMTPAMSNSTIGYTNNRATALAGCSLMSPVMSSPEDGIGIDKSDLKSIKKTTELPPPPKKPLSPYMRFSKGIWQKVKAANPGMTVCEVGANIGRVWRELSEVDKQRFNEEFLNDKARYDTELQQYLQATGLQASDLIKPRTRKKDQKEKPTSRKTSRQNSTSGKVEATMQQELNADLTSLHSSNEVLTPVGLPPFSQVWSQSDLIVSQDNLVSDMAGQNIYEGTSMFADNSTGNDQLLNGISIHSSLLSQNNIAGDLHQSALQTIPNCTASTNSWSWQQLSGDSTEQEHLGSNQTNLISSLQSQHQAQQFKRLMTFSIKSNSDIKQHLNIENLTSNGLHSDLLQAGVDAEKLLLRSALVEKSQEVLRLMKELEQAYGLIHQLKQQNDFFHQHWNSAIQQNNSLQVQSTTSLQFASNSSIQQMAIMNSNISSGQQIEMSPKSKEGQF